MSEQNSAVGKDIPGFTAEERQTKIGLAEQLRGGVIMDVTTPEQAKIAEDAGACAVMALERVPADIRKQGGVARMSAVEMIQGIQADRQHPRDGQGPHRSLRRSADPRGARSRLHRRERSADDGGRGEPRLEARLRMPFVCGCRNLGEALRRIHEGAAMIRTKGEPARATSSRRSATCGHGER
jgi:pyridoxal 5'-phosphate synthase pdxS subunit